MYPVTLRNTLLCKDIENDILAYYGWEYISKYPLSGGAILQYMDKLDWKTTSGQPLSFDVIIKCAHLMDWDAYLMANYVKDSFILYTFKNEIASSHVLKYCGVKMINYTDDFIDIFSDTSVIDWNWYARNKKISSTNIEKYWGKFNCNTLLQFQTVPLHLIKAYGQCMNWKLICKYQINTLTLQFIEENTHQVYWDLLVKYCTLPEYFISRYRNYWKGQSIRGGCGIIGDATESPHESMEVIVPKYNSLSEDFISNNTHWLDMDAVSSFQKISCEFILHHQHLLNMHLLALNKHFNGPGQIQILLNPKTSKYVIIPLQV